MDGNLIVDGSIVAQKIDTRGLTIRDTNGNIILGSGTGLPVGYVNGLGALATQNSVDYSAVSGTKPPSNADKTSLNTAAGIAGQGAFATLSQINPSNISTYIAALAVGTLQIAGEAVTIPRFATAFYSTALVTTSWSAPGTLISMTVAGLNAGETMRVVAVATGAIYPADGSVVTFKFGVFVNGVLSGEIDTTLGGNGISVTCIGSALLQNGVHSIDIRGRTAASSKWLSGMWSLLVIGAKR